MQSHTAQITFQSETETRDWAAQFAARLSGAETIFLAGSVGAGKSLIARTIIQTLLGADTDVPSPTFTLIQTYEGLDFEIWHADLYRLTDVDQVFELGLDDMFGQCIALIEWPEILDRTPPTPGCRIALTPQGDDTRLCDITCYGMSAF